LSILRDNNNKVREWNKGHYHVIDIHICECSSLQSVCARLWTERLDLLA